MDSNFLVFRISGMVCDHNLVFWIFEAHYSSIVFCCVFVFLLCKEFVEVFLLILGIMSFAIEQNFGLDVVYQLGYFYIMCCEYGDNNSCRRQPWNARQIVKCISNVLSLQVLCPTNTWFPHSCSKMLDTNQLSHKVGLQIIEFTK